MRFVFHYPEPNDPGADMLDPGAVHEVAAAAERSGFDGFSFSEHPAPSVNWLSTGGHQTLDSFVALGSAAAATEHLQLLTYLTVVPYRNPLLLAKTAATLDKVSGGRLILGLGTGYQKSEFHALGVDFDERNELFDEALDVLPLPWSGEPFSYTGKHFEARDVIGLPRPVQRPIPIWIGGNSTASRQRVAERAQGWMPLLGPPELTTTTRTSAIGSLVELADLIDQLRQRVAAAGRVDTIDVVVSYDDSSIGSPTSEADRHREAFAATEEAGVTWMVVSTATDSAPATFEFLDGFGSTYLV